MKNKSKPKNSNRNIFKYSKDSWIPKTKLWKSEMSNDNKDILIWYIDYMVGAIEKGKNSRIKNIKTIAIAKFAIFYTKIMANELILWIKKFSY